MRFQLHCDPAPFSDIATAAHAEDRVDWSRGDTPEACACTVSFAAMELAGHLQKIVGVQAELGPPGDASDAEAVPLTLQVGDTGHGPQSYVWEGNGRDGYRITGADRAGVLYGAYAFLDRLGFRWFSPDEGDEVVPAKPERWPCEKEAAQPSFEHRGFRSSQDRGGEPFLYWMARRKMNLWTSATQHFGVSKKLGMVLLGGTHGLFQDYLNPADYFDSHPEYFALIDGQRSAAIDGNFGDNPCFSNPDVCRIFSEALVRDIADGVYRTADMINVWPLDGGRYCQCADCRALGNPTRRFLHLAHHCRRAIREHRVRDVKLVIPAYHETLPPPSKPLPDDFDYEGIVISFFPIERCYAHALSDPRCEEINETVNRWYRAWTEDPRWRVLVGEYYNVSTFAGIAAPLHDRIDRDLPYYADCGTRDIHYMHVPTASWGTLALTNGFYASKAWDTECSKEAYVADFTARRYGALGPVMAEFYETLQQAMRNVKAWKHYIGIKCPEGRSGMRTRHMHHRNLEARGNPETFRSRHFHYAEDHGPAPSLLTTLRKLEQAEALIDQALVDCTDPVVEQRLCRDARRFRYTRNLARFMYTLVRVRIFQNSGRETAAELEACALRDVGEALRAETEMMRHIRNEDGSIMASRFRNGLTATWLSHAYAEIMAEYGLETPDTPADQPRVAVEKDKVLP